MTTHYVGDSCEGGHIDPVCLIHGRKKSEHDCLYCCLCFKPLTREECSRDDDGQLHDVCKPCTEKEQT